MCLNIIEGNSSKHFNFQDIFYSYINMFVPGELNFPKQYSKYKINEYRQCRFCYHSCFISYAIINCIKQNII